MKHHWAVILLAIAMGIVLIGCTSEAKSEPAPTSTVPAPTIYPTEEPPEPTAVPPTLVPTETLPPPTAAPPTATATLEPTPSRTPKPHGTFAGCITFEGELVVGYFTFDGRFGLLDDLTTQTTSGCATIHIPVGTYEAAASYYQGPVCSNTAAGCKSDKFLIEIIADETLEMEIEVLPAGSVRN